ncbi:hypothetical protein MW871_14905 [Flavobacterium sp. I-SCBP12n]|uniref:Uncharacterized protein n=1 Tax=Flavobacterium pygoscelis TaxID=2893176 RepID=A0A9X1XTY7_9FLAO|nr:hypothetical protein [Flavobacterium pygoscelis]MCK8143177.1 hypothetical protein [Flavobacterium pygoscelis]
MEIILLRILSAAFIFMIGFFFGIIREKPKKKTDKAKGVKCTCSNPQWCDIRCTAKELFYEDSRN